MPCAQPVIDRTMPAVADAPWRVLVTVAELPAPRSPRPFVADLPDGWTQRLAAAEIPPGTPFLMSPTLDYDVVLNEFFRHLAMLGAAPNTQVGYARNLAAFLSFCRRLGMDDRGGMRRRPIIWRT
jgi:hypothetical protein